MFCACEMISNSMKLNLHDFQIFHIWQLEKLRWMQCNDSSYVVGSRCSGVLCRFELVCSGWMGHFDCTPF